MLRRLVLMTLAILCLKCILSGARFEGCNHFLKLQAGEKIYINSPYYPNSYPAGTSCRYTVEAPNDYELKFTCDLNMTSPSQITCGTEIFYFNREGSELLSGSDYFCGSGSLQRKSLLNKATISYISSSSYNPLTGYNSNTTGYFSCLVESLQLPCDCGWTTTLKVAGGSEATLGEFPSMAAVVRKTENTVFCGATISKFHLEPLHHRYLLSAAHCFASPETSLPHLIEVIVGDYDLSDVYDSFYSQHYDVGEIIKHKNFRMMNLRNDIALLRTARRMEWNRVVGPACLPFRFAKKSLSGYKVDTAGWGTTSFGGQQSNKLLKTSLDILRNDVCKTRVGVLTASQFCTSTPGKDTCQYDSGGGLYLRMTRMYAVGIVSYGFGCAGDTPSVNSRISTYLKWVQAKTNNVKYCVK